jgi:hypothetical protein
MRTYNNKLRAGIKSTGQKKLSCRATAFLKYSFLLSAICFIACATYSDQWRNLIRARLMELGVQKNLSHVEGSPESFSILRLKKT